MLDFFPLYFQKGLHILLKPVGFVVTEHQLP